MSTCVSRHGEFGSHEPNENHVCKLCGVFDEDAALATMAAAIARVAGVMDLVEFLTARLDEDEQVARSAEGGTWSWRQGYGDMCDDPECRYGQLMSESGGSLTLLMDVHGYDVHRDWEGAEHIARHDPARVLREVEAKRAILSWVEWHVMTFGASATLLASTQRLLLALASVYADHPDYQEEWRP